MKVVIKRPILSGFNEAAGIHRRKPEYAPRYPNEHQ